MKKKIAVYANGWSIEALFEAVAGIRKFAAQEDFDVFVFLCFANISVHTTLMQGELNVYKLCNVTDYDGIISFSNMLNSDETALYLCQEARQKGVPIISIGMDMEGVPSVKVDGNTGMRGLVTHLVEKHGVKDVVFIGGTPGHMESDSRLAVTRAVLEEHGLSLPQENVVYGGWSNRRTIEALHSVLDTGRKLPDAIVCANDIMGLSAATELKRMGYSIPEDVIVTGFDHIQESQIFYPALTSVKQNYDEVGYQSCRMIYDMIIGGSCEDTHMVSTTLAIGESCGCDEGDDYWELRKNFCGHFYQRNTDTAFMEQTERSMRQKISEVSSYADLKTSLRDHFLHNHRFEGENLSIVLNADYFQNPMATEQEIASKKTRSKYEVVVALKNGEIQNLERMDRRCLVPGYEKVDGICHVYYILPLHFYQYSYGYVVFADEPYIMREGLLYSYMEKLQQALKLLRTNLSLDMLNQNLTKLYDKDPMTGLFNRFGYENKAIPLYQESVKSHTTMMVMFVDINYLKHINDRFGHIHGDAAIKTVADGIKEILRENWIAIRFGGDEFLIIAPNCDKREAEEVRQSILQYLEEKNNEGYRLYRISTSIGYVITDPESGHPLQEYIREADRIMYEIKRDMHAKDDGNIEAAILPDGRASMEA
ncbi:MAG: GGDEF domain-containing protein [Lachnospiraceae bacterium]|nr:GGDEF domain-containing protein [Lachnospiraceae bacterium]